MDEVGLLGGEVGVESKVNDFFLYGEGGEADYTGQEDLEFINRHGIH